MLESLIIDNVAVIEHAQVQFGAGLNVLTGETGAGKSILIDSINAILGNRASREMVRTGAGKAQVRAVFTALPPAVREKMEEAGYEAGEELLLFREIGANGKGSCRVNGLPCSAAFLREVSRELIDIHGQHDSQGLLNPATHLKLLDDYAQNEEERGAYRSAYRSLVGKKRELDALKAAAAQRREQTERLRETVEELEAAALQAGEEERLLARRQLIQHAKTIREALGEAKHLVNGTDSAQGAADQLGEGAEALVLAARQDPALAELRDRLREVYILARDLGTELADKAGDYVFDAGELDSIEDRLDGIDRMKKRYGGSEEAALARLEEARTALAELQDVDERLEALNREVHEEYRAAREAAARLTAARRAAFAELDRRVSEALAQLNMAEVRLLLRLEKGPLASHGQDTAELLISTNPGEEPRPLARIASGGELSRIMLAIKSAMAERDALPTIIYDEIDAGVSGSAAGKIGRLLKESSRSHQILCITHTAQIASFAATHLLIRKEVEGGRTYSRVKPLDADERVRALAVLISGDHVTDLSLANAREMIDTAQRLA